MAGSALWRRMTPLALGLVLSVVGQPTAAQDRSTLEITPLYVNGFLQGEIAELVVDDETGETFTASLHDAVGYGLIATVRLGPRLSLELSSTVIPTEFSVESESGSEGFSAGAEMDLNVLAADITYRFREPGSPVRPFVTAGGGVKLYDGEDEDATWGIGAGILLEPEWPGTLRVEVRDRISTFDGFDAERTQHDILLGAGIVFGLF